MQQVLDFFKGSWPDILFGLGIAAVVAVTYYLTRRTRSDYMARTALATSAPRINEGIIRHIITSVAGLLVMLAVINQEISDALIGGVLGISGLILSWQSLDKDMLQEKLTGIFRHVLTFLGGIGVIAGEAQEATWLKYGGIVIVAVGIIWSIFNKKTKMTIS